MCMSEHCFEVPSEWTSLNTVSVQLCENKKLPRLRSGKWGPTGRVSKAGIKGEYSHLKFGSFWRWFKWRWNHLKTVFSTGNWSVNNSQVDDFQRESRYLSRRAPMSFITHLKGETGICIILTVLLSVQGHSLRVEQQWAPSCFGVSHTTGGHIGEASKRPLSVA